MPDTAQVSELLDKLSIDWTDPTQVRELIVYLDRLSNDLVGQGPECRDLVHYIDKTAALIEVYAFGPEGTMKLSEQCPSCGRKMHHRVACRPPVKRKKPVKLDPTKLNLTAWNFIKNPPI